MFQQRETRPAASVLLFSGEFLRMQIIIMFRRPQKHEPRRNKKGRPGHPAAAQIG
jgi:hypothetical protein